MEDVFCQNRMDMDILNLLKCGGMEPLELQGLVYKAIKADELEK